MLFKSSASPKENPGSKRLRRTLGLLLGSALAVQYKQDRIFRASVNLQLVMVLNYLYAAYNLLTALQSGSMWLLSLGIYTLMLAIVRTDLTLSHHRGRKLPPDALPRHESRCYRRVAWSLLVLNVPIGGLTLLMVSGQSVSALPGHLIYLSALYTFVMMFLAISNLIRFRKLGSPILSAAKVLSLVAALLSLLITFSGDKLRAITFWTMGNLSSASYQNALTLLATLLLCGGIILTQARALNAMSMGEEYALHVGVSVRRVKLTVMICVSAMIGMSVSVGGGIGFVGLVTPHMIRLIVGANHRRTLPACLYGGAIFLLLADLISRTILAPAVLPVGVVTSIIGAAAFLVIFLRTKRRERA